MQMISNLTPFSIPLQFKNAEENTLEMESEILVTCQNHEMLGNVQWKMLEEIAPKVKYFKIRQR